MQIIVLSIIYGWVVITLCIDIPFDVICAISISSVNEKIGSVLLPKLK